MAKKLRRLKPATIIKSIEQFQSDFLHFIKQNNSVYHATPLSFGNKIFLIKDSQGHRIKLPLQDIKEVWQEYKPVVE